jgi:hypothetical protein
MIPGRRYFTAWNLLEMTVVSSKCGCKDRFATAISWSITDLTVGEYSIGFSNGPGELYEAAFQLE